MTGRETDARYDRNGREADPARGAGPDAPQRAERLFPPGSGLEFELRRRRRRAGGTLPPFAHRHGSGIADPRGPDGNRRSDPRSRSEGNRRRIHETERPVLDRTVRQPRGIDDRPDSRPPGRVEDPGVPRRRFLDSGRRDLARRPVRLLTGRHRRPVRQDACPQGPLHRRDTRSERHRRHLPRQYMRRLPLHVRSRRRDPGAYRSYLQNGPDRPFHRRRGRTQHRQPRAAAFHAHQEDTRRPAVQASAEPPFPERESSRDRRARRRGIRSGVPDPPAVPKTDDRPGRSRGQTAGYIATDACICGPGTI